MMVGVDIPLAAPQRSWVPKLARNMSTPTIISTLYCLRLTIFSFLLPLRNFGALGLYDTRVSDDLKFVICKK